MGWFGRKKEIEPPHPRKEPRFDLPLNEESIRTVFRDAVDFGTRKVAIGGDDAKTVSLFYIIGMVRGERVNDYLLRPLAQDQELAGMSVEQAYEHMRQGALYNLYVKECDTMDQAALDLVEGNCLLLFPGKSTALSFLVATEEKRSVSPPENENSVKGARDSFVESLRTNTSLVRRRMRAPELRIAEHRVGRQSITPVDVLWMDGIADPDTVHQVQEKIAQMDISNLSAAGYFEEYVTDESHTPFPLTHYTERPDRFCEGLTEGRVGVLVDGIPVGWLFPATVDQFLATQQDLSSGWMTAAALLALRYLCLFVTLLLPAVYIAAVTFHPEMLPAPLMQSIVAAKRSVPFGTVFEVLLLLAAFEVLQEAGRYLPAAIGQTASILGGLVVGSAAVEARIVSPAVLVVVAIAGIAGFTQPNQDFSGALRIWRFVLAVLASLGGLPTVALGISALLCHLGRLETFGVPYLSPFASATGDQTEGHTVFRMPLPKTKLRQSYLRPRNRRNQR